MTGEAFGTIAAVPPPAPPPLPGIDPAIDNAVDTAETGTTP
jgi:hypothetical protein